MLSPDEIEQGKLENGWSPKALFAHIAFWDDRQGRRIELLQEGHPPAVALEKTSETNEQRAAQDASRSWEEVMAQADAARQRLVGLLETFSAEQLNRQFQHDERTFACTDILQRLVRHTYEHAHDLVAFCGSMQRWQRAELRQFIVQQYLNLMDSIAGLDEKTILSAQVCGSWSIRDVLAHVLSWYEFAVQAVKGWPQPAPQSLAEWAFQNEDEMYAINARLLAARADLDIIAICDGLTTAHRRLMRRFDRASAEELASWGDVGWSQKRTLSGFLYEWALHDLEHAEQIWRYRAENP